MDSTPFDGAGNSEGDNLNPKPDGDDSNFTPPDLARNGTPCLSGLSGFPGSSGLPDYQGGAENKTVPVDPFKAVQAVIAAAKWAYEQVDPDDEQSSDDETKADLRCFQFVRHLRFSDEFCALSRAQAAEEAMRAGAMVASFEQSEFWETWLSSDAEEVQAVIFDCWNRSYCAPEKNVASSAMIFAKHHPVDLLNPTTVERSPKYHRFLGTCYWLQKRTPSKSIVVSQDVFAEALEVRRNTIGRFCKFAIADLFMRRARAYSRDRKLAAEFWFNLDSVREVSP